jgi:hypothetical protein
MRDAFCIPQRNLVHRVTRRTSVPSPKSLGLRCVQNGPPGKTVRAGLALEGASRSTSIFLVLLVSPGLHKSGAGWALRSRLEKQPTDLRRNQRDLGDGALEPQNSRTPQPGKSAWRPPHRAFLRATFASRARWSFSYGLPARFSIDPQLRPFYS